MLATGASTTRTLPNRLADIINVKDYGAVGNSNTSASTGTDDTTAIQAAVTALTSAGGGTLFFPVGIYKVTSSINLGTALNNISFIVEGVAASDSGGSFIVGNFADFIFKRPGVSAGGPGCRVFRHLKIKNLAVGGGGICLLDNDGGQISNCSIQADYGVRIGGDDPTDTCFSTSVDNCLINGIGTFNTTPASSFTGVGIQMGPETQVSSCSIVNFGAGIKAYGFAGTISGCRIESNTYGVIFGARPSSNDTATDYVFSGSSMEGNYIGIYMISMIGGAIIGVTSGGEVDASHNSKWGLQVDSCNQAALIGCNFNGTYTGTNNNGIYINQQPTQLTFINCGCTSFGRGAGVVYGNITALACQTFPALSSTLSDLSAVSPSPTVGQRFLISDCNTALASQTYNTTATGGGSNLASVWWDGTNFRYG
jgi:hypothetical protein